MNRGSIDKTLIITVIVLVIIGLIAVYSSTSVLASVKAKYADRGGMIYLQKQLFTLIIGSLLWLFLCFYQQKS